MKFLLTNWIVIYLHNNKLKLLYFSLGREKKDKELQSEPNKEETEALKKEEALKTEMELKSIKSELNLSDHTQIIKYEPNVKHGACKVEGE